MDETSLTTCACSHPLGRHLGNGGECVDCGCAGFRETDANDVLQEAKRLALGEGESVAVTDLRAGDEVYQRGPIENVWKDAVIVYYKRGGEDYLRPTDRVRVISRGPE